MIIIGLSDIHGQVNSINAMLPALEQADLVLLVGDITHFSGKAALQRMLNRIRQVNPSILGVSGNCDYPEVDEALLIENAGLHRTHEIRDGFVFAGLGSSLPCPGRTPNESSDHELAGFLSDAAANVPTNMPMILVSHQPPLNTLTDYVSGQGHVGSKSVRNFIDTYHPLICFTGHIHEARGIDTIGSTKIINPGPLWRGGYAWAKLGDGLERLEIRNWMK